MQINLGKLCNQTCRHCHVDAWPDRTEVMTQETVELCVRALERTGIPTVDITGGAPELNPSFQWLIERRGPLGRHVMNRCNLCSLPHYQQACTDVQRGDGVFEKSIGALRQLIALGYGRRDARRWLVLVTNPVGARLPAAQDVLEVEWKRELPRLHGVSFDAL